MRYCCRCLYPDTKPNLWFDDTGLCSACVAFDARARIDWKQREADFMARFPRNAPVVVACSGGKDSTYLVVKLKELGLRPLAVCATTDDLTKLGRRNLDNIGRMCDLIEVTPNKALRHDMARYALETVGDISWCEHVLIWSVPARVAKSYDIQWVFYGENPQNEYGAGPAGSAQAATMQEGWEHEFGGMLGLRLSDMMDEFSEHHISDWKHYMLPVDPPKRVFMGYYFPWDGESNAFVAAEHGFRFYSSLVETSVCTWENLDNYQTGVHDYLRYVKYGYSRAQDILSSAIRRGGVERKLAVECANMIDPYPWTYLGKSIEEVLGALDVPLPHFFEIVNRFTNPALFELVNNGAPRPKFKVQ